MRLVPIAKKPTRKKKVSKRKTSKPKTVKRKPAQPARVGSVKDAQKKWIKNAHDERAVANGCVFDERAAMNVVDFFATCLRHSKGSDWGGKPFILLPWEIDDVVYPVFGWKQLDGFRRIRVCHIWVPKKTGKSTLGSGLGIFLLAADGEPGSEVYSVATKRDQAAIVHAEAINMVRAADNFDGELKINESTHVISHPASMSKYATLAADSKGSEGINAHGFIIDEMHAWDNRAFWNTLRYATRSRKQPLTFVLSTAGIYDVESIGHQQYTYAAAWRKGKRQNQRFHAFIAEASPKDAENIEDPEVHRKANPSYGVTIDPAEMMAEAKLIKDMPSDRNNFLRYCLNIWVEAANPWLTHDKWDACLADYGEADLVGRKCFGGLDLASKIDLAAFVMLFPPDGSTRKWQLLTRFFLPSDNILELKKKTGVDYLEWERRGWLILTDGGETDYETIKEQIVADAARFKIEQIGADKWELPYFRQRIDPNGKRVIEYPQDIRSMSPPFKELTAMIVGRRIEHDGNEVMRWMVSNVKTYEDSNENVKPIKGTPAGKIDGVVAVTMALGCSMVAKVNTGGPSLTVLK